MSKAEELAKEIETRYRRGYETQEQANHRWLSSCKEAAAELRRLAALEKAIMDAEPVAVVGSTFQLLWSRQDWSEGLKVGDFLYTLNGIKKP